MKTAFLAIVLLAAQTLYPGAPPPVPRAEAFFDLLVKHDTAAAYGMFNENMRKALPQEALQQFWASITAQAGAFQSREPVAPPSSGPPYPVVIRATFARGRIQFMIGVTADGRIGGLSARPLPMPSAPPPYADAAAFTERDITVGSGEWALPGTLAMPNGSGPFPAIVLVHGSGPNDRDESLGPNKPFRDLAQGLASRGIAVLRYDKRTHVHGAKLSAIARPTVHHEVVEDAALAVNLLAATPSIAPDRIFVAGHSLGAMLIPRIAAAAPAARGFILLAAPARPLEQAILEQIEYMASLDAAVTPEEQKRIDGAKADLQRVRGLTPADVEAKVAIGGVPASYWLDLRGYDAPVAAKAVARPMLVMHGERDYQVTLKEFARWQAALAGRADVTFKLYAQLNHLFMTGTGPGTPMEYAVARHVDEKIVRDIAAWMHSHPSRLPLDVNFRR